MIGPRYVSPVTTATLVKLLRAMARTSTVRQDAMALCAAAERLVELEKALDETANSKTQDPSRPNRK